MVCLQKETLLYIASIKVSSLLWEQGGCYMLWMNTDPKLMNYMRHFLRTE